MIHECGYENRRPGLAACSTTEPIEYAMPWTMMVTSIPVLTRCATTSWIASPSVTLPPALLM